MENEKRLIDRNEIFPNGTFFANAEDPLKSLDELIKRIWSIPTVDAVEVVHGRWEDCSDKDEKGMELRCLVCGGRADSFVGGTEDWYCLWMPNFCPHCGARMDGDEDDNDT